MNYEIGCLIGRIALQSQIKVNPVSKKLGNIKL